MSMTMLPPKPTVPNVDDDAENVKLPNPYDITNKDSVKSASELLTKLLRVDKNARPAFCREWFLNILYYVGIQWIIWEKGRYRRKNLPRWWPKIVTNKFAEKANDLISNILQSGRAPIVYSPATDDEEDRATAEIGERFRSVAYEEAEVDEWENLHAAWVVLTGNSFLVPYYDNDEEYGTTEVQMQRCQMPECDMVISPAELEDADGKCPKCGQTGFMPAVDESANPIMKSMPIGCLRTDVCSPFEIRLNHKILQMKDHKWFVRTRLYDVDFAKDKWPDFAEFIKPASNQDGVEGTDLYYLNSAAYLTSSFLDSRGSAYGSGVGGTSDTDNPQVIAYELRMLPNDDYPDGLRMVRLGTNDEAIVELEPLDTAYGAGKSKDRKFLSIVHFGGDIVPGRFWRKTRMSDLVQQQSFRNIVESAIKIGAQRMGNAGWLNPIGCGVEAAQLTGEQGLVVDYQAISLGGTSFAKPERIPAELGWLQPLIMLLNKIDDNMERIAGTFFLGGGDTPPGVTAASALAFLGERANKAMSPWLRAWVRGWKRWEGMVLEIMREHMIDERVITIAGRNKQWETQKFSNAKLQGAVNMIIDYEGIFPKSQATARATLAQLIQLQVLNPADPAQQFEILKAFGETRLRGSIDLNTRVAAQEWDRFMNEDEKPVLVPLVQDSVAHLQQHADDANSDEFRELSKTNPAKAQLWLDHITLTAQDIVMRRTTFGQFGGDPSGPTPDGSEAPTAAGEQTQSPQTQDIAAPSEPAPPHGAGQ